MKTADQPEALAPVSGQIHFDSFVFAESVSAGVWLALLARGSAWSAAGSNHMTLNYCQAGARFPHRFKVAVNVEDQGSRDGVIDLIG
jgi:hypothetical protein